MSNVIGGMMDPYVALRQLIHVNADITMSLIGYTSYIGSPKSPESTPPSATVSPAEAVRVLL